MPHGWAGAVSDFLASGPAGPVLLLRESHARLYHGPPSGGQVRVWEGELRILRDALSRCANGRDWGIVLEYELPFEGGRRPDAVVLAGEKVLVLEFKEKSAASPADVDQVRAYSRDLAEYHTESHGREVLPVLVLVTGKAADRELETVHIVTPASLAAKIDELAGRGNQIELVRWLASSYAPLPALVEAARRVFRDEPLPAIRRAESAGVNKLIAWLHQLIFRAFERKERHLVLITGVPGAGKTLVGLQFVHESQVRDEPSAIFLSGNGPLVEVLQGALHSTVFVRPMRDFILEYGVRKRGKPNSHVFVFDEAQRAWDIDYMTRKHSHAYSEPAVLLQLASELPDWGVVVGLVGEGQEIHVGEEAGMAQWVTAVREAPARFALHVPPHLGATFQQFKPTVDDWLNLTLSLRTHRAERVQDWVAAFIAGDIAGAERLSQALKAQTFDMYVTTDLLRAKRYAFDRYGGTDKRFGLLASAKAHNLVELGIDNGFTGTRRYVAAWYNAPPNDPRSSCQLSRPETEFQSQGLELDLPIVCWGDDLRWEQQTWRSYARTARARDSHQLRLNSYRVLLTRGRDGFVVYLPDNLPNGQQSTLMGLCLDAGMEELRSIVNGLAA
jgi:hypothetical protein